MSETSQTCRSVELLRFLPQSRRTATLFDALRRAAPAAGLHVTETTTYRGEADLLMLWGAGAPNRWPAMAAQLSRGCHYLTADLAYWSRYDKFRVSIDAPHPQAWVMRRDWPPTRLQADRIAVSDDWHPDGPVVIAGIGDKARVQYGDQVDQWEQAMIAEARRRGHARIQVRPKRHATPPIDVALRGAALVITWHSNVAVDAIRQGIPVICRDGAAAAVCPSIWPETLAPLAPAVRDRFLANLAFWQWGTTPTEAIGCWRFLQELLACG